jgi:hypothetical protein
MKRGKHDMIRKGESMIQLSPRERVVVQMPKMGHTFR